ncbi:MAG: chaperone modulator CbpM [Desulfatiglandaceae bacterium]
MSKEFWTITEVVELFEVEENFLIDLEQEEILCPKCRDDSTTKLFSSSELEKLRIAKILFEDMGVNVPGIEVILRMRQTMFDMRNQFDAILEGVAEDLRESLRKNPQSRVT